MAQYDYSYLIEYLNTQEDKGIMACLGQDRVAQWVPGHDEY